MKTQEQVRQESQVKHEIWRCEKLAKGAIELSLLISPRLDPRLRRVLVSQAMWWIPRMRKERHADIFSHVGLTMDITFQELSDRERYHLSEYLNDVLPYSKINKGKSVA